MEALKSESVDWDGYMSPKKNGILLCNTKPLSENTKLIRDAEARISSAMVESKVKEEMVG